MPKLNIPKFTIPKLIFTDIIAKDLINIMQIEQDAYSKPWALVNMQDCLHSKYIAIKMVDAETQLILGYCFASVAVGESSLLNITICPHKQGCGLGYILLMYLIDLVITKNATEMFLEVRASNKNAYKLYEHAGFNQIGLRKNYYPCENNQYEDAIIMAKTLINPFQ